MKMRKTLASVSIAAGILSFSVTGQAQQSAERYGSKQSSFNRETGSGISGRLLNLNDYLPSARGSQDRSTQQQQRSGSDRLPYVLQTSDGRVYFLVNEDRSSHEQFQVRANDWVTVQGQVSTDEGINLIRNAQISGTRGQSERFDDRSSSRDQWSSQRESGRYDSQQQYGTSTDPQYRTSDQQYRRDDQWSRQSSTSMRNQPDTRSQQGRQEQNSLTGRIINLNEFMGSGQPASRSGRVSTSERQELPYVLQTQDGRVFFLIGSEDKSLRQQLDQSANQTVTVRGNISSDQGINTIQNPQIMSGRDQRTGSSDQQYREFRGGATSGSTSIEETEGTQSTTDREDLYRSRSTMDFESEDAQGGAATGVQQQQGQSSSESSTQLDSSPSSLSAPSPQPESGVSTESFQESQQSIQSGSESSISTTNQPSGASSSGSTSTGMSDDNSASTFGASTNNISVGGQSSSSPSGSGSASGQSSPDQSSISGESSSSSDSSASESPSTGESSAVGGQSSGTSQSQESQGSSQSTSGSQTNSLPSGGATSGSMTETNQSSSTQESSSSSSQSQGM